MFRYKSTFLVAVLVFLLAACGQPVSVEDAEIQLCASLEAFEVAMEGVTALTPESTVEEAEEALAAVDDAWDDVASAAYNMRDAEYENLEQAYEDLDDAIRDLDEAATMADATATVQAQVETIDAAYAEFRDLHCAAP